MAVVKADGYGHGAVAVAGAALAHGATRLAVYTPEEGVTLRAHGITAPILVFGPFTAGESRLYWRHGLTPTVTSLEAARTLQMHAGDSTLEFQLKLDTGLSRAGVDPGEAVAFLRWVARECTSLRIAGVYTHFASADELDKSTTRVQLRRFGAALDAIRAAGFAVELAHASNSAALLDVPDARFSLVRAGIATYGYYPSPHAGRAVQLTPVLQLLSEVTRVHSIPPGTGVGYGHEFRATRPTTIALVPIGYGDGLPRTLGNGSGRVLIRSRSAPIVGRVSMDQITVDVSEIDGAACGDDVVLIGAQGELEQTAEDLGAQAGTISYDILTGLLPRVPRIYVRGGALVGSSGS